MRFLGGGGQEQGGLGGVGEEVEQFRVHGLGWMCDPPSLLV